MVASHLPTRVVAAAVDASCWYAAYTWSRHEKKVAEYLRQRNLECFLPLYTSVRHWNDRSAELGLPLFPGYVFVRLPLSSRLRVLEVPGVVHLVSSRRQPLALPDEDMQALRNSIQLRRAEPCAYLAAGRRVRIIAGPLQGLVGVIQRLKNHTRIVVSVDWIMRSVALELDAHDLDMIDRPLG